MNAPTITLQRISGEFERVGDLLDIIRRGFAYMDGVIDPPSSAHRLDEAALREKCAGEVAIVALEDDRLVGCVFLAEKDDHFYLGKLVVDPALHGKGIGKMLVRRAERIAVSAAKPLIELQVRVELTANQATFERLGYVETARTSHPGYTRPTSITMRKALG
jgi:ribosomal protein S18 acetylase RimI-like enzyme